MKILGAITLFLFLCCAAVFGYFVPSEFHKAVHQKLIPEYGKGMKITYSKLGFSNHQTVLTGQKYIINVNSVSEINFLNNHLLVTIKPVDKEEALNTKVNYKISNNLDILVQFEDFISKSENSVELSKPVLRISTPLSKKLLNEKERANYVLFNTSIDLLIEKLSTSWKDKKKPDITNKFVGKNLSLGIAGKSPTKDSLKIIAKLSLESAEATYDNVPTSGKNFLYEFSIGSFNIPGLKESFKDVTASDQKNAQMPFMLKLMQAMPKIKQSVHFPFIITNTFSGEHPEGPSNFGFEASVDDPDKGNIMNIFKLTFELSTPLKILEAQATNSFASLLTSAHSDAYYPAGRKNPMFLMAFDTETMKEKNEINKEIQSKLPVIFTNYLNTEIEGKKRSLKFLDKAVEDKLVTRDDKFYKIKGEFSQMQLSINGELNASNKLKNMIAKEEVDLLMKDNGFISVFEGQTPAANALVPASPVASPVASP